MRARIISVLCVIGLSAVAGMGGQNTGTQTSTPKAGVEGVVTKAGTSQPLKGARISVRKADAGARPGDALGATTDSAGKFTVSGLDPGQYRVFVERDGYIRQEFGQRTLTGSGTVVSISAGQQLPLEFHLVPAGVISGRVLDETGEPVYRAPVQAYAYQYRDGKRTLSSVASGQTNDLGEYRLFWLPPGEYFVSVTPLDPSSNNRPARMVDFLAGPGGPGGGSAGAVAFAVVNARTNGPADGGGAPQGVTQMQIMQPGSQPAQIYFPGVLDADGAAVIPVTAAADVRGIDINVRPIPTVTVRGRVLTSFPLAAQQALPRPPAGDRMFEIASGPIQLAISRVGAARPDLPLPGGDAAGGAIIVSSGVAVKPDGTFEIAGLIPGSYNLIATARAQNGLQNRGRARVEVGYTDVNDVSIPVAPGSTVNGRIAAATGQQLKMNQLRVTLAPVEDLPIGVISANVGNDGQFVLENVPAFEMRMRLTGLPGAAYLESATFGSADALNAPFTPGSDQQGTLQVQIGASAGRVSGTAFDVKKTAFPGAVVALVPDDPKRARSDLYFSVSADQNGRFNFPGVPPGGYRLFAWDEIPSGAYQSPDFIRRFEDRGKSVRIEQNGAAESELDVITRQ